MTGFLRHPLLEACGGEHGFGLRGAAGPRGLARPRQVHGLRVVPAEACSADPPPEADGVVTRAAGRPVGVVTADCVPILLSTADGTAVAAVHAGWRGLAGGVVGAGAQALAAIAPPGTRLVAAIGPHIGACCYEVDAPVLDALARDFADALETAASPSREGHVLLDLGALAARALARAGVVQDAIGRLPGCTRCDAVRFHSYRRDGPRAGRMTHFIAPRGFSAPEA